MTRILAIEDNDQKWERVEAVIRSIDPQADIVRADDMHRGEMLVENEGWELLILDVSLDIRAGAAAGTRGTHDFQAGLKIASRMFYLECEIPTIIVTGFDSFPTGGEAAGRDIILGLEDVDRSVRKLLGDFLLGTVRYGGGDWEKEFKVLLEKGMKG